MRKRLRLGSTLQAYLTFMACLVRGTLETMPQCHGTSRHQGKMMVAHRLKEAQSKGGSFIIDDCDSCAAARLAVIYGQRQKQGATGVA